MDIHPLEQKHLRKYLELLEFLSPTVQGTTVQGTTVQGTTVQGTTVQGTTVQGTTVQGTTVWKQIESNPYHTIYGGWLNTVLVGAITVYLEPKFIHQCGWVAHIEDVIVHPEHRGFKFGSKLVKHVLEHLPSQVYKISLNCRTEVKPFYEKLGFSFEQSQMVIRR